jgi:hypothetical protein
MRPRREITPRLHFAILDLRLKTGSTRGGAYARARARGRPFYSALFLGSDCEINLALARNPAPARPPGIGHVPGRMTAI